MDIDKLADLAGSPLVKSLDLVHGDRAAAYGSPRDNVAAITAMLDAYLSRLVESGTWTPGLTPLPPQVYSVLQILTKIARLANNPDHADSWVDIAGYVEVNHEATK